MYFRQIFEEKLAQYAYLIGCQRTGEALLVDPQRDIDRYLEIARNEELRISAVTETHIHADFLSGARELAERGGVRVYLSGEGGEGWSYGWADPGRYEVSLLRDGDTFQVGNIRVRAVHTPGHTPEHLSFMITDEGGGADEPMGIVSGDFVFVGDLGRPDLLEKAAGQSGAMEPAARRLYRSALDFLELPDYMQVWPGHGAGSACGKALGAVPESTVGYERRFSPALDFVQRGERDFVQFILEGQPEPPAYFARMKAWNRDGPPVLGSLPVPSPMTVKQAGDARARGAALLDTRVDRRRFMAGHLQGSLAAPRDKTFPTIAGSYVTHDQDIVLVADPDHVREAVLDLIRIGLDRIIGFVPVADVEAAQGLVSTPVVDFQEAGRRLDRGSVPLDVRRATEFAEGHLPGSTNIAHTRLALRLDDVPEDVELLVYCRTGARAAAASSLLEREGFRVAYVDDMFAHWRAGSVPGTAAESVGPATGPRAPRALS